MLDYCSQQPCQKNLDIIGVNTREIHIAIEIGLPWHQNILLSEHAPKDLPLIVKNATKKCPNLSVTGLIPHQSLQTANHHWVIFTKKNRPTYTVSYYLVPSSCLSEHILQLVATEQNQLPEKFSVNLPAGKDILICTHQERDKCCGYFGSRLYQSILDLHDNDKLRIWQSSHLGGHRLAPTFFELPSMRWWGSVTEEQARSIICRSKPFIELAKNYRGWAFLDSVPKQMAEREIFSQLNWDWLEQSGDFDEITHSDKEVLVTFRSQTGNIQKFIVNREQDIELFASCRDENKTAQKQFKLRSFS